jgi:CMP-N-acetylneuraminic acid synthetase
LNDKDFIINNTATAMLVSNNTLYVAMQKFVRGQVQNVICGYELSTLTQAFEETWNICQNTEDASYTTSVSYNLLRLGILRHGRPPRQERNIPGGVQLLSIISP